MPQARETGGLLPAPEGGGSHTKARSLRGLVQVVRLRASISSEACWIEVIGRLREQVVDVALRDGLQHAHSTLISAAFRGNRLSRSKKAAAGTILISGTRSTSKPARPSPKMF